MRLGVRSQKRTGIISILFAGILIWKYLTGNEHVKFYPWQDSQSPNISNICPSKTHGVLSKKWSCWSETNLRHGFGPIAFFRDDFPHQHFENRTPAISLATSQEFGPNPRWVWVHTSKNCQSWISCKHWVWRHDTFASSSWGLVDPSDQDGVWGKILWRWMIWRYPSYPSF
jgi:hypothetical protein